MPASYPSLHSERPAALISHYTVAGSYNPFYTAMPPHYCCNMCNIRPRLALAFFQRLPRGRGKQKPIGPKRKSASNPPFFTSQNSLCIAFAGSPNSCHDVGKAASCDHRTVQCQKTCSLSLHYSMQTSSRFIDNYALPIPHHGLTVSKVEYPMHLSESYITYPCRHPEICITDSSCPLIFHSVR